MARQALTAGNLDSAEKLIAEALRQDPNDPETLVLKNALEKSQKGGPQSAASVPAAPMAQKAESNGDDLNLVGPTAAINDKEAGAMAEGFQQERKIITQVIQAEVLNTINQARKQMSIDPDAASQESEDDAGKGSAGGGCQSGRTRPIVRSITDSFAANCKTQSRSGISPAAAAGNHGRGAGTAVDHGESAPRPAESEAIDGSIRFVDERR